MVLPPNLPIDAIHGRHDDFIRLTQAYYDPTIRTKHTDIGGVEHLGLGYGGCALPLVLAHNTPNNAVALLWADTEGGDRNDVHVPAVRPALSAVASDTSERLGHDEPFRKASDGVFSGR